MPTVAKDPTLAAIFKANHKAVQHLKNMRTQEPRSGEAAWVSGSAANMHQVITKRQAGREFSGSFDRYVQRNRISAKETRYLEAVFKFAAGRQVHGGGVLALEASDAQLRNVETELNDLAKRRDANRTKKLESREAKSYSATKTGKATLEALTKINERSTRGLDTEMKFSKRVNKVIDLLYSKGDLTPDNVREAREGLSRVKSHAVDAAYQAVSRHMSHGRTDAMEWICRDQRQEVQRILMNLFGGNSETRAAIDAVR